MCDQLWLTRGKLKDAFKCFGKHGRIFRFLILHIFKQKINFRLHPYILEIKTKLTWCSVHFEIIGYASEKVLHNYHHC